MNDFTSTNNYIQLNNFNKRKVAQDLQKHKNRIYKLIGTYVEDNKTYYTDINFNIWRDTEVKNVLSYEQVEQNYAEHLL